MPKVMVILFVIFSTLWKKFINTPCSILNINRLNIKKERLNNQTLSLIT